MKCNYIKSHNVAQGHEVCMKIPLSWIEKVPGHLSQPSVMCKFGHYLVL